MSKEKYDWNVESCVNEIWQQCCVRSTTRQKIYIEKCIDRLLKQIKCEIRKLEGDGYEGQRMIDVIGIEKVFNKYLNEK